LEELMRQLVLTILVAMALSACGWESEYEEQGSPEPTAPGAVSWDGAPIPECVSDMDCAETMSLDACEVAICDAGTCAAVAAPIGTACDPGGLGECVVGKCTADAEAVSCQSTPAPDGMPCMVSDWEPPMTIRTCYQGSCAAATECLVDADCADQEDGDLCNGVVSCIERYCVLNPASVVDCADFPVGDCEVPVCNPATGACMAEAGEDGLQCDDGDECTGDDKCSAGECIGVTVLCETVCDDELDDDDDGMTDCDDDECEDLPVCQAPECGDGDCNGEETCETCPGDCGECAPECGDEECNGDETCETCPEDCGPCADPAVVYFSEYVEGGSNNKAVEIYNGGAEAVDLDGCFINRYSNGDTDATQVEIAPEEETLLGAGEVWVLCNSLFQEPQLSDGTCQHTTNGLNHNGNDALELVCDGVTMDVFGRIGEDPGADWIGGDPAISSKDMTLRRSCAVTTGDTDGTDAFDPSVEWEGFPQDTFDGLGAHVCD